MYFSEILSKNLVLLAQSGRDTVIQSVRRSEGNFEKNWKILSIEYSIFVYSR